MLISPLPPPVGGIASWTINLMDFFNNHQNRVRIILIDSAIKGIPITSESPIKRILFGIRNFLSIYFKIRNTLSDKKPDVIHLNSSASLALFKDYFILRLAKHHKIPVVIHWRFGRIPTIANSSNWEWRMLTSVLKKCDRSIVIDNRSYNTLHASGFRNISNVPNPIAQGIYFEANHNNLIESNRQPGRLIFVGHIVKSKGVYELVTACSQLSLIKNLILIGPYEEITKNELLKIARTRENGEWLTFLGTLPKNKVLNEMFLSPILVLPSFTEGFPNVILEAMIMGCAIIASDVGAIPEMLDIKSNKPCGICIPPQNVESLKKAISELMQDDVKIRMMGKNGINRILNNYSTEKIAESYYSIWVDAINAHHNSSE